MPLALIKSEKTVDPRNKSSTPVFHLETAMGDAISSLEGARAVVVPRSRFAPVKKIEDLMALRSDAYHVTEDSRLELAPQRQGIDLSVPLNHRNRRRVVLYEN